MIHSGFNLDWLCRRQPGASVPDERVLDAIAGWGFNFVRLPMDYRLWSIDGDPHRPDEEVLELIDDIVTACCRRGLHLSLNLRRAPGDGVAGGASEPNLWADRPAQDAFVVMWKRFALRYQYVPRAALSFDLVNEPPAPGLRGFTPQGHEQVIRRTVAAIRAVDPDRPVVVGGRDGGELPMPELADLEVTQSTRGYQPMSISHHRASWQPGHERLHEPHYPEFYDGRWWDLWGLFDFYAPWRDLERLGVAVHVGEAGCYEHTPDDIAQAWFDDLLTVFSEFAWGFALKEFAGPFGVVGHRRPGAVFEYRDDFLVDVWMLERMQAAHEVASERSEALGNAALRTFEP